ncbi:hypothetical protein NQZ68_019159 [Dissostichus eleginoides]|nr:hypothetical protein NQZ68_019159 [Dissostichus eleginoides]
MEEAKDSPSNDVKTLSVNIIFSQNVFHQSNGQTGEHWQVAHISPARAKWASPTVELSLTGCVGAGRALLIISMGIPEMLQLIIRAS